MPSVQETRKEELLEKIKVLAEKKLPASQAALLLEFAKYYYNAVSAEELHNRDIDDLFGALLSHWALVYQRKPGETHIRIYNPNYEQDGWQSTHTIIEISHDDMPFLVDSIQNELNRRGITTHIIFHAGNLKLRRDKDNRVSEIFPQGSPEKECLTEAPIFIEIDRITDPHVLEDLRSTLLKILHDVEISVADWPAMCEKLRQLILQLKNNPPPIDKRNVSESIIFLEWLLAEHFIFLGYRDYLLKNENGDKILRAESETGLGVLRETKAGKISKHFSEMSAQARAIALSPTLLILAKSNIISSVHRAVNTDIVGIKMFNEKGEVIGEHRFVGLYTSRAYHSTPKTIPILREKVESVLNALPFDPRGHSGKAIENIIENIPRDDLFQASGEELKQLALGIFHLQERKQIRLFVRKDIYGRFISCLVFVPRDRFNTELRAQIQNILVKAFHAQEVTFNVMVGESVLARIHFMLRVNPNEHVDYDIKEIEEKIIEVGRFWHDDLRDDLIAQFGEERGTELANRYDKSFPAGYRESFPTRTAVADIDHIESLSDGNNLMMSFFKPLDAPEHELCFKLYRLHSPVPLSDALPILENMGLRILSEQPYRICRIDGDCAWINEFTMKYNGSDLAVETVHDIFQTAFAKIWFGIAENDGFNKLVLGSNLNWREVVLLRAYAKYFKQIGFTFSQSYIEDTCNKHSNITNYLIQLFKLRFDPNLAENRVNLVDDLYKVIIQELENVSNLDEDRILRRYLDVIMATTRTNYYQLDPSHDNKPYLSFKFDPNLIPEMPLPRPQYEIWVYSPKVEGVHLRSSKVARGGLRWSDRREDFRTEVLGLMKAQKVKNAVIVPSGAKGGFVTKALPVSQDRDLVMQEVIKNYKTFIRGLLDLTDNLVNGNVVYPENTVRHDGDDYYLVVAADKGTATFSNYANEVARDYHFWLDDAFASGGMTGYDHKKMGITARGAWESVKRHFREMGRNSQTQDFTVVGIGDLAGDVFGNGMLLSEHIKLIAAFNHMHIFIDPTPDPKTSFAERDRLFNLPRSTWEDYNPALISKGGGVFSRAAKYIVLSPEMKEIFSLDKDRVEPNELIRAILMAKVDLLFNGGIGTFVKSSLEINEYVGDKTNDSIRVNGKDLNTLVVVEGGNLGFTQLGRVEYALNSGRIFTDFIDNSAGVDCSDHEVNLKILLNRVVSEGDMTIKQRNELLSAMTDDVAKLVLKNNYWQTQAISIAQRQADKNHDLFNRFIQVIEATGKLDRDLEYLPDDKGLQERKGQGKALTAPEIAVLLAYSKIILKEDILLSDVPEDSYLSRIISTAFPTIIREKYHDYMIHHSLRRDIIATQLSNIIINKMGITYVNRVQEETGASVSAVVRAYTIAHEVFAIGKLWEEIEALDYHVELDVQVDMMQAVSRLVRRATRWFLRNHRDLSDIEKVIDIYHPGIEALEQNLPVLLRGAAKKLFEGSIQNYRTKNVPEVMAKKVSATAAMFSILDIVSASTDYALDPRLYAQAYFIIGAKLELGWMRANIVAQAEESHWDALAKAALRDDIDWQQRELAVYAMLLSPEAANMEECVATWMSTNKDLITRWKSMIIELRSSNTVEFVKYAVAVRELLDLTQASKQAIKLKSLIH